MVDDDFDSALGDTISGEIGGSTGETDKTEDSDTTSDASTSSNSSTTENTSTTETADDSSGGRGRPVEPDSLRQTLSQYPLYLPDELQDELDEKFRKMNARRELEDEGQVEKHKHFMRAVVETGLEGDWEDRVDELYQAE